MTGFAIRGAIDTARGNFRGTLTNTTPPATGSEGTEERRSMRHEILISGSEVQAIATSPRASKQRCLTSLSMTAKWFDAATKYEHADVNPTSPGGPGGAS